MKHLLYFLALTVLFSCSVQKRKYQKGFYVNRLHQKNIKKHLQTDVTVSKSVEKNKPESLPIQVIRGDLTEHASQDNSINAPVKKRPLLFLQPVEDSCDVLLFKDGSEIRAKVDEVSQTEVKYHRCDNISGPAYVTRKSDLFMIKYANGTRELIKAETQVERAPATVMPNHNYNLRKRVLHPLAPVSLAFGVIGIILAWAFLITLSFVATFPWLLVLAMVVTALIALITGRNALSRIKEAPEVYKGKGLAAPGYIMGLVLMIIYTVITLIALLFIFLLI